MVLLAFDSVYKYFSKYEYIFTFLLFLFKLIATLFDLTRSPIAIFS